MIRIAIVDPSEVSRESLRAVLLGVDFVWLEAECARYEYFFDVIKNSTPDAVIINLDGDKQKALSLVGQLVAEYPRLPIVTLSNDSQALLQSLQLGAKFFLTQPVNLELLVDTLRKASAQVHGGTVQVGGQTPVPGTPTRSSQGQVFAMLGTRGGVGTTTLAVNLAASLAQMPGNNVALIDLDLALGDADIALELPGKEDMSLADLARNIERLDMNYLKRALVRHPDTGVSVLRRPVEVNEIAEIHEGHVERVVNLLKVSYSHLIIDCSKAMLPTDIQALRMSEAIFMVAQLELSSLRNVVRLLHSMGGEPELVDRIRLIVNRTGADHISDGISLRKAEEVVGRQVFWQIPNDAKAVIGARAAGMAVATHAPKSKVVQAIVGLAETIAGRTAAAGKKKGWFS